MVRLNRLDQETGQLSMQGRLRDGDYNVQVRVYDVVWKREVVSTVNIVVKEIGDEAIANSGSIRLQGSFFDLYVNSGFTGFTRSVFVGVYNFELTTFKVSSWISANVQQLVSRCVNNISSYISNH